MFRKVVMALLCVVVLSGAASAAITHQSVYGPTGLLFMPTAQVAPSNELALFYKYIDTDGDSVSFFGGNATFVAGLEAGLTLMSEGDSMTLLNAKYVLPWRPASGTAIGVGVINLLESEGDSLPYVVLSQQFPLTDSQYSITGHVGYFFGWMDEFAFGADMQLTPQLKIMAEFFDDDLNFGAAYQFTPEWQANAAFILDDLVLGVTYKLPLR